jgi:hypothetical protein
MIYTIVIVWDEEEQQWMYMCEKREDVTDEEYEEITCGRTLIDLSEFYDEDGLELIEGCYIMGET